MHNFSNSHIHKPPPMATAIEAKSLSSLTALADEPPDRLNAQFKGHAPLVLYIARVPGSQGWHRQRNSSTMLTK